VLVVDDDVVAFVNGHVQIGDALDGVANDVQVLPAMIFRPSEIIIVKNFISIVVLEKF
jgi:hypothetical protein